MPTGIVAVCTPKVSLSKWGRRPGSLGPATVPVLTSSHIELFQKTHLLMDPRRMSLLSCPVEQFRAGELSKWPVGPIFWDVITHG